MPWSNQSGKGPWGSGDPGADGGRNNNGRQPRKPVPGGRGPHSPPPDMDDILRKGQQQLKQFGGGAMFLLVAAIVALFWLFQCFYVVQQNEQAVVLRFGKPQEGIVTEGWHFHLWPVESYRKVSRTEQTASIGTQGGDGLMLSADQNIVNVNFSVYYYIADPNAYLFNVNDPQGTIQQVAESAMREIVGRRPVDDVYRDQREAVAAEVLAIIQSTLGKYDLGVQITRVSITRAEPPQQVVEAFNSVQNAEQERKQAIEQGNRERERQRGLANGEAAHIHEEAVAYKTRMIEEARGEAARFVAVAKEAKVAPEATRFRLRLETFEQLLSAPNKLVLDKATGAVTYLPLNELLGKGNAAGAPVAGRNASTSPAVKGN